HSRKGLVRLFLQILADVARFLRFRKCLFRKLLDGIMFCIELLFEFDGKLLKLSGSGATSHCHHGITSCAMIDTKGNRKGGERQACENTEHKCPVKTMEFHCFSPNEND